MRGSTFTLLMVPSTRDQHSPAPPADHGYSRRSPVREGGDRAFRRSAPRSDRRPTTPADGGPTRTWSRAAARAARGTDIVHVHFGFEHRNADQLADFADEVHAGGAKLVVTVHDIDCPHVLDQEKYRRALRVLVRRADAVITLTESAADECEAQFGVRPRVIPRSSMRTRPAR